MFKSILLGALAVSGVVIVISVTVVIACFAVYSIKETFSEDAKKE